MLCPDPSDVSLATSHHPPIDHPYSLCSCHGSDLILSPRILKRLRSKAKTYAPPSPSFPLVKVPNANEFLSSRSERIPPPATDTISSICSRAARKLAILGDGSEIALQYLWCDVYYTLEDGTSSRSSAAAAAVTPTPSHELIHPDDDWEVFLQRHQNSDEVTVLLTSPSIPTSNPSIASISSVSGSPHRHDSAGGGGGSQYSSRSYGRTDPLQDQQQQAARKSTSMHLVSASSNAGGSSVRSFGRRSSVGGETVTEGGHGRNRPKSFAQSIPEHKIKFEEFHNQVSWCGFSLFFFERGPAGGQ